MIRLHAYPLDGWRHPAVPSIACWYCRGIVGYITVDMRPDCLKGLCMWCRSSSVEAVEDTLADA